MLLASSTDLDIPISDQFASSPLAYDAATGVWNHTGAILNVPAMPIIAAVSTLLVIGIDVDQGQQCHVVIKSRSRFIYRGGFVP